MSSTDILRAFSLLHSIDPNSEKELLKLLQHGNNTITEIQKNAVKYIEDKNQEDLCM